MEIFVIAAVIAVPIAWGLLKLDDHLNGDELVFYLEEDGEEWANEEVQEWEEDEDK